MKKLLTLELGMSTRDSLQKSLAVGSDLRLDGVFTAESTWSNISNASCNSLQAY